jgi:hypothetical protein
LYAVNDIHVARVATYIRDGLHAMSDARLFTPSIYPTPDTPLINLVEPIAPGYAPAPLTGLWSVPRKAQPGQYYFETPLLRWDAAAGPGWTHTGFFLLTSLGWFAAERLPSAVTMVHNGPSFFLKVRVFVASANLLIQRLVYSAVSGGAAPAGEGVSSRVPA